MPTTVKMWYCRRGRLHYYRRGGVEALASATLLHNKDEATWYVDVKPAGEPAAAVAAAGRQQPSRRNVNNDLKSTLKLAESIRSGSTPPAQTAARPKGWKEKASSCGCSATKVTGVTVWGVW